MSPRAARWIRFLVVYVAIFLLLGGAATFVGFADHDHHYVYQESTDEPPDRCCVTTDDDLTPAQQSMVDRAIAGEQTRFVFERADPVPAEIVRKDGTYHVFAYYTTFDWSDRRTHGPVLVSFVGVLAIYGAFRWEHRYHPYR
ncbi:hypothetical protein HSRCO_2865 [Halanaeroarchaeum sp. HSR-CO]|uniref:hypothetical protein n=1 Tax=Halanaeroarchaeum sp. HSR-CO TaxID=2866382 RepID=UPI00217D5ACC|nr:hypothetical protein [Halanaeroarchaeum sp. HSR-CO]UWG49121.1 hypothetical protein HSRCO_2865 [Halanaeroarchaeum sp. HSR-CO]